MGLLQKTTNIYAIGVKEKEKEEDRAETFIYRNHDQNFPNLSKEKLTDLRK